MTTPGPAKPMVDLLRGHGPRDYAAQEALGAYLEAVDPLTGANTVSDGAARYTNLPSLTAYAQLVVGHVVLLRTEGLPIIISNLFKPTV